VRLVIPFGIGILLGSILSMPISRAVFVCYIVLLCVLLGFHFFNRSFKANYFSGILITFLFCLLGSYYFTTYNATETMGLDQLTSSANTSWLGEVEEVKRKDGVVKSIVVQVQQFKEGEQWKNGNFNLLVYNKDSLFNPRSGDIISAEGNLMPTQGPKNPAQFDYQKFLTYKNIYRIAFEDEFIVLESNYSIFRYAESARKAIVEVYQELGFREENLAVLVALTLGDKSYLDSELQDQYAGAGAMHILAVSGLHVGIVFLIFNFLLSKLPNGLFFRIVQTFLLLLVIWSFAFLAGLSPSVQRAGWMFSFVILSKLLKRNTNILNSISVSAFLLLLLDPNNLFQVGFQLSYSAVIGIVLIHPVIYKLFYFPNWMLDKIWSLLVVSLAAQLATLPFTLAYFHQFPNYFLFANLLVIPLAFAIVSGSVVIVSLFFLFKTDFLLAVILDFLLSFLNGAIAFITAIPGAVSDGIWFNSISILFLIGGVVSLLVFLYYGIFRSLVLVLCCILGIQVVELVDSYKSMQNKQLTFYALKHPTWSVVFGRQAEIFALEGNSDYDRKMVLDHMNSMGVEKTKWNEVERNENQLFVAGNLNILLFPESLVANRLEGKVDLMVPSDQTPPIIGSESVVLNYFYRNALQQDTLENADAYYNFRKDQAFVQVLK